MNFRLSKKLFLSLLLVGVLLSSFSQPASAAAFTENFSTTTYKDVTNTTADWNTTLGRLQLAKSASNNHFYSRLATRDNYTYLTFQASDCVRVAKFRPDGTPVDGTDPSDFEGVSFGDGGLSPCISSTLAAPPVYDTVAPPRGGVYIIYKDDYLQRVDGMTGQGWWDGVSFPNDPYGPYTLLNMACTSKGSWTMAASGDSHVFIGGNCGNEYYITKMDNEGRRTEEARVKVLDKALLYGHVNLAASGNYLYLAWQEGNSCFVQKYRQNNLSNEWASPLEVSCSGSADFQASVRVVAESGGNFYLLSHPYPPLNNSDFEVRKIDGNKASLWGPISFGRSGDWSDLYYNESANELYAVWRDFGAPSASHRIQRFNTASGAKLFGASGLGLAGASWAETNLHKYGPDVVVDNSGNAVAAYVDIGIFPYKIEVVKVAPNQNEIFRVNPPPLDGPYQPSGRGQSLTVATTTGNILRATLTATQTLNGGSISYYLSANGGANWEGPVTLGSAWTFANPGKNLRWRADLTRSATDTTKTPWVDSLSIDYQEAPPCLERSPSTLTFTATAGGSNPTSQNINITNSGGGTLSWASSDDQTWMTAVGASPGSTVNVSINISGLVAGTYTGTVTLSCNPLSSCQAGSCQQKTTAVTLTVNPAPVPAISRDPTSLTFTAITQGQSSSEAKTFQVWNSGGSGSTLNWTLNESANWFRVAPITGTSTGSSDKKTITVTLENTSSLAAGTYTSNITISDPSASNTPQTVSVSLTVNALPCLERSPSTLTFTATAGGSNPTSQNINITNSGGGTLSWASSDDQTWMTAVGASPGSTVNVSINISGLVAGTYTGTVTLSCNPLSSCQAGSCQQKTTAVTLTVNPAPVPAISRSPTSLTFTSICEGATSTESKTFEVWNSGDSGSTLNWVLSESASWFGVAPGSGSSTGEHDVVTVTLVNTSSLAAGTYTSNITISDPNASNTPQTVSVGLTVNSKPCLERSPSSLTFTATAGGSNPSSQNINISNSGVCSLSWQSSDDQAWMSTTDASSTSAVSINISGLTAGNYTGTVTLSCSPLSSCQAGTCQQKQTSVTLTVNDAIGTISGHVYEDNDALCPIPTVTPMGGVTVEISAGYSTQTTSTGSGGDYTFSTVPYNPSGTVYTVTVSRPPGDWSFACAGGFSGQGFKDVTLATGTSSWTVDFSMVNTRPGWFQVIDGDIHSEGDIEDNVP